MNKCIIFVSLFVAAVNGEGCVPRNFGYGSVVCVCDASYCDSTPVPEPEIPKRGTFYWYVSTKDGQRLNMFRGNISSHRLDGASVLTVNSSKTYQSVEGWGAAFTDSAGINVKKLSKEAQERLMRSYFGAEGSRYTLGRVPIGGCDFSTRPYTYDDVAGDVRLQHFHLTEEDVSYKIPLMKWALELQPEMRFLAAAWTAPPWMKTNDAYRGLGFLKGAYYQTYADYLLKFVDEYKRRGIPIWAISTGNEPSNALVPLLQINTMGWMPWTMGKWIAENLGPTLGNSSHNDTIILALDDQRLFLPWYVGLLYRNGEARKYCTGVAVHMYWDEIIPGNVLDKTRSYFPEQMLLMTEASIGGRVGLGLGIAIVTIKVFVGATENVKVALGSWERGERYILNIIQNVNHWMSGWIDWNMALDEFGGPNWVKNYVDASIIVNSTSDEFYKQPMYYAVKHVSRFVGRGSVRIDITDDSRDVKSMAFLTPKGEVVIVLCNTADEEKNISIEDEERGSIHLQLHPRSIHTVLYEQ